jgi:acyl-coenzyme A synthetase/AMP-(fatty) acid ligase
MSRINEVFDRIRTYAPLSCVEGNGCSYSYAQLLQEIAVWSHRFDDLKIGPRNVVAVSAEFSYAAICALFALLERRSVAALIPRVGDSSRYLSDAHATDFLEINCDGSYGWRAIASSDTHPLLERLHAANDAGIVIFTSGSTGRPKAALHSAEHLLYKFCRSGRRFRTLAFLLFDHVAGLDTLLYTLTSGGTLIVTQQRDPNAILNLIESHAVEVLPTSPSFLRLLCLSNVARERDLSSLKIITYGSEPMDASTLQRLNELFPSTQISQKYGTTETGSPRSASRDNNSLWISFKRDGFETKVIDGVLWLRGSGSMLGYLNAASPLDEDGWYCTGDLVETDGEWLRFIGRVTDIINVGGEKVAPLEVEQCILELDFVTGAVVSGERHPLLGQTVTAKVTLTPTIDSKDAVKLIRAHCRARLTAHKTPIRIEVMDAKLTSDRGKAQRQRIDCT